MLADQEDEGPLHEAHRRSRKVWWRDNGKSQSSWRGGGISEQSQVRCRGTRSCHSMDLVLFLQNKNFSGDGKAKSHVRWHFTRIWHILWRIIVESSYFNTSSIRDEGDCWKEQYAEERKERLLCCCHPAWMENGGRIPWNAIAICEVSKTSWQMGKPFMRHGWENQFSSIRKTNSFKRPLKKRKKEIGNSSKVRLLHRSRWTHRVPLRVQQDYEVTERHRETEAILCKSKTKTKRRATIKQRDVDSEISLVVLEFTENLEDAEALAPAHISHDHQTQMKTSGLLLWKAIAICEMSKTPW